MKSTLISRAGCLPYNPKLTERARELRKNMTSAEKELWYHYLRYHRLTFHRQKIIENYIVDFYCSKALLVIEIDGDSHFTSEAIEYDSNRTAILEAYGIQVIRFTNYEVINCFERVCLKINELVELRLTKPSVKKEKPLSPL